MNAIKEELGEKGDDSAAAGGEDDELSELKRRLDAAHLSKDAQTVADRELKRLKKLHPSSVEWSVVRTYLDVVADLPWSKASDDLIDIHRARDQLEADHYGYVRKLSRLLTSSYFPTDIHIAQTRNCQKENFGVPFCCQSQRRFEGTNYLFCWTSEFFYFIHQGVNSTSHNIT